MTQTRQVVFKVFHGPNLNTDFAAVSIEFADPSKHVVSTQFATQTAATLLNAEFASTFQLPGDSVDFVGIVFACADALQNLHVKNDLRHQIDRLDGDLVRISVGFYDVDVAAAALQCGYDLAAAIFARQAGGAINPQRLRAVYSRSVHLSGAHQPDISSVRLMRIARSRDIPFFSFAAASNVWMYGYGARGVRFWGAIPQDESFVGTNISRDKVYTQRVLQRAGFPGVQFGVAENVQSAREIARVIGYPLVVKPTNSWDGQGVSVGIMSDSELDNAFAQAHAISRTHTVQIEQFVPGEHYRLSVLGGKFQRAALYQPARVVGDGRSTLRQLIVAENSLRAEQNSPAQDIKQIGFDANLTALLSKQGYSLDDRPPDGAVVMLRRTSNTATGGRVYDVTEFIHPDNIELAETVARVVGIRGMGMDLISPDITKSWRDTDCAIIEVNCPYSLTSELLATKALAGAIPIGENGRIPCIMISGRGYGLTRGRDGAHRGGGHEGRTGRWVGLRRWTQPVGHAVRLAGAHHGGAP